MDRRPRLLALTALSAVMLQGCQTVESLNILAAIDGPYISPSERAEMERAQAVEASASQPTPDPATVVALEPQRASLVPPEAVANEPAATAPEATSAADTDPAFVGPVLPAGETDTVAVATSGAPAEEQDLAEAFADLSPVTAPREAAPAAQPVALAESAPQEEMPTSVGPGFLPPEAPLSPIAASPSTAFIGPLLEDEPVQRPAVQEQAPSAFDFVTPATGSDPVRRPAPTPAVAEQRAQVVTIPASAMESFPEPSAEAVEVARLATPEPEPEPAAPPREDNAQLARAAESLGLSVVSSMPSPGTPARQRPLDNPTGGNPYRSFYDFAVARLEETPSGGARESMLLLDPPSLDPALQQCGNQPPAVLIDLDPANGLLPLVSSDRPNPELAGYLAVLRQRGVTIYWISGHAPNAAASIRERLTQSALDPAGTDPLIVTRFAGESKQERRYALGESHCLLAILGDHRGDFDELYDFVLDPIMAGPLEVHIGEGWFIAPPPLD